MEHDPNEMETFTNGIALMLFGSLHSFTSSEFCEELTTTRVENSVLLKDSS